MGQEHSDDGWEEATEVANFMKEVEERLGGFFGMESSAASEAVSRVMGPALSVGIQALRADSAGGAAVELINQNFNYCVGAGKCIYEEDLGTLKEFLRPDPPDIPGAVSLFVYRDWVFQGPIALLNMEIE